MLFYSYCPECGTESKPFRVEPKDGTPMVCQYCGNTYPYKTRHWMAQRIIIRSILTLFVLAFIVKGCAEIAGCDKRSESSSNAYGASSEKMPPIKIDIENIDAMKGLAKGYEWGSGKWRGKKEVFVKLNRQAGWDGVRLFYGECGHGLEAFTLIRKGVWIAEIEEIVENVTTPWCRSAGKNDVRTWSKGNSFANFFLPEGHISISVNGEVQKDGKTTDLNLAIVNKQISSFDIDVEALLLQSGYKMSE